MDVIKLLRSKNRCLERLLEHSTEFVAKNDMNLLESFQLRRDSMFRALDLYDHKIAEVISTLQAASSPSDLSEQVKYILAEKDRLIQNIILKDNELMSLIELKKAELMREITSSRKTKSLVGKFKSSWVTEAGEEIDQKL